MEREQVRVRRAADRRKRKEEVVGTELARQKCFDSTPELGFCVALELPVHALDQDAGLVNEEAGRRGIDAVGAGDEAAGISTDGIRKKVFLREFPRGTVLVPGDIHAEKLESLLVIFRVDLRQNGSLPFTVRSG